MTDDDKALVERLLSMADEYDSGHHESWPTIDALEIAAHRIEALSAENERLRVMSLIIADWLRCAPMESGVCCCGDPIEEHGYDSGHSPVDAVQYSAMQLESEIRAALGDTK